MTEIIRRLEQIGVIPVIAIEHIDQALDMADALIEGGLPVAEITFRTEAAAGVIARLHERRPELLIGAIGTWMPANHLAIAHAAGAAFALAPGADASVIAKADQLGIPFYPGVLTPSDIQIGLKAGASVFKFFPVVIPRVVLMLIRSILAPFAHLGIRTIPTGGITPENLSEWLREPTVLALGGTWIASRQSIAAGDWDGIRERAVGARSAVVEARIEGIV